MDHNSHRNRCLALSNKIDAFGGDGENEKQDRRLQRQAVVMAMVMAMARDIQPHSTQNPLIKPIQPKNNEKQRKKERSVAMAIGGDGDRRKLEKERLMRGRKIDQMRERKRCAPERERELRVRYREEREKIVKKLYAHATVPVHICMGTVATCIYTQVCMG